MDSLQGGAGRDSFQIISSSTANQDVILDYEDGLDSLVLTDGLHFGSLSIHQNGANTDIIEIATHQTLATLVGIDAMTIDHSDFV